MTATDELRKLLDERGVEWEADDRKTYTFTYWGDWAFTEPLDAKPGTLGAQCELMCIPASPEQAITATLESHERTCEMYRDEYGVWHCKACESGADVITGNNGELDSWHDSWAPNYCPYCGRRGEQ